jgi:DNA adenine methylase
MLVYLNRTGFNGLFRLNSAGDFNVPIGRYANPTICDEERLRRAATSLGRSGVRIVREPFYKSLERAQAGDFVYLDPPYAPLGDSSDFTSYTAGGFTLADQRALQRVVVDLARRGCKVLLSNSTADVVRKLYVDNDDARHVGLVAKEVPARRAINSKATKRGNVMEYVVTNVTQV